MTFDAPGRLWLLLAALPLAAAYLWLQRRRRHRAIRYTNIAVLAAVAPKHPAWRRHVPAALVAIGLASLAVSLARPMATVRVPKEAATVMLVVDTSVSMRADDVEPSRLAAAIDAATGFVDDLPERLRVGLVAFDGRARVLAPPTVDHRRVRRAISGLTLGPGTAAGDGLFAALDALAASGEGSDGSAIVLLSDGVTTMGQPVLAAAQAAADAGIPVTTIAFGSDDGGVVVQGRYIPVPADPDTMAQVAEVTSGRFFEAVSGEELRGVYEDIGTRVGYETEEREVSGTVVAAATLVLALALGLGLLWNGRVL